MSKVLIITGDGGESYEALYAVHRFEEEGWEPVVAAPSRRRLNLVMHAFSDPANHGSGHEEPILMVISYGGSRVFHTTMGHDLAALNCVGFITTYQRGAEWAATGKVTQKAPADFPTVDNVSTRKEYDAPPGWVSPGGRPRPRPQPK